MYIQLTHCPIFLFMNLQIRGGTIMSSIQNEELKVLRSRTLANINQGAKRTHSFMVDYSEVNPEFKGRITVHYPSQLEKLKMGVTKSSLLSGMISGVDVATDNLATIISTLDVVLDESPSWFNVDNVEVEYHMFEEVFLEYVNWVNSFRTGHKEEQPIGDSKVE